MLYKADPNSRCRKRKWSVPRPDPGQTAEEMRLAILRYNVEFLRGKLALDNYNLLRAQEALKVAERAQQKVGLRLC